jgi:hypothetical protein
MSVGVRGFPDSAKVPEGMVSDDLQRPDKRGGRPPSFPEPWRALEWTRRRPSLFVAD